MRKRWRRRRGLKLLRFKSSGCTRRQQIGSRRSTQSENRRSKSARRCVFDFVHRNERQNGPKRSRSFPAARTVCSRTKIGSQQCARDLQAADCGARRSTTDESRRRADRFDELAAGTIVVRADVDMLRPRFLRRRRRRLPVCMLSRFFFRFNRQIEASYEALVCAACAASTFYGVSSALYMRANCMFALCALKSSKTVDKRRAAKSNTSATCLQARDERENVRRRLLACQTLVARSRVVNNIGARIR